MADEHQAEEQEEQPEAKPDNQLGGISDTYDDFREADDMLNNGRIGERIDKGVQDAKDNLFGKKKQPKASDDTTDAAGNNGENLSKPGTDAAGQDGQDLSKPGTDAAGQNGEGLSQPGTDAAGQDGAGLSQPGTDAAGNLAEGTKDAAEVGKDAAEGVGDAAEAGAELGADAAGAAAPGAGVAIGGAAGTGAGVAEGAVAGAGTGAAAGAGTGAAAGAAGGAGAGAAGGTAAGTAAGGAIGLSGLAAGGVGVVVTEPIGLAAGAAAGAAGGAAGGAAAGAAGGAAAGGAAGAEAGGAVGAGAGGAAGGATGAEAGGAVGEGAQAAAQGTKELSKAGKLAEKAGKVLDVMDKGNKIIGWIQKYWKWCCLCCFGPSIVVIALAYYITTSVLHLNILSVAGQAILSIFHRNTASGNLNFTNPASQDAIKNGDVSKAVANVFTAVSSSQKVTFNFVGTSPVTGKTNEIYEFDVDKYGLINCIDGSNKLSPIMASLYVNFDWNSLIVPGKESARCAIGYYPGDSPAATPYSGLGPGEFQLGNIAFAGPYIAKQQSAEAIDAIVRANAQKIADENELPLKKLSIGSDLYSSISLVVDQSLKSAYPDKDPREIIEQIPGADGIHFAFD